MDTDSRIREIEKELDVYHMQSKFIQEYKGNRNQALLDVLRVFEFGFIASFVYDVEQDSLGIEDAEYRMLLNAHNLQDALKIAVQWIYDECILSQSSIAYELDNHCFCLCTDFLINHADPYSLIVDGFTSYSQGLCGARYDKNKIYFDCTSDFLRTYMTYLGEQLSDNKDSFQIEFIDLMKKNEFSTSVDQFSTTIHYEDGKLCYEVDAELAEQLHMVSEKHWENTSSVPHNWEFDYFSLSEFKKCWDVIYQLCFAHFIAILKAPKKHNNIANIVIIQKKRDIIDIVSELSGCEQKIVTEIIRILTYDPKLKNNDIMYQPLVEINDCCIITPSLIMSSSPERNLICILQAYKDKMYFKNVNELEQKMISDLKQTISSTAKTCSGVNIGVTDIDFGIYDLESNAILISEMKWLIAADSVREV